MREETANQVLPPGTLEHHQGNFLPGRLSPLPVVLSPHVGPVAGDPGDSVAGGPHHIRTQVLEKLLETGPRDDGQQRITLQLDPPHLGRVQVLVQRDGDQLTITFTAAGDQAEAALREGAEELAEALLARGRHWGGVQIRWQKAQGEGRDQRPSDPRDDSRQGRQREQGQPRDRR